LTLIAETCARLGDTDRAAKLYELLEPYANYNVVVGRAALSYGPATRYLGLLARTSGRFDEAERHFEAAAQLSRRMGDRPYGAMIRLDRAEALLARDAPGDRDRALDLLSRCLDEAQDLGMRAIVDRALAMKLEAQGLAEVDVTTSIDAMASAVESERPDLRAHAAPDGTVTILFSDIENSTVLTERLGDERWLEVLRAHNSVFRDRIRAHRGFEVKSQGDGFMLVFPNPAQALRCALEIQQELAARSEAMPDAPIRVRMGLHTGEVVHEEGDVFGRNVILAARIAARAQGGEILVSEAMRDAASGDGVNFDNGTELELKGLTGTHRVYRAIG
jgi:eukaryotic-like serine/threonine-protein kinase